MTKSDLAVKRINEAHQRIKNYRERIEAEFKNIETLEESVVWVDCGEKL